MTMRMVCTVLVGGILAVARVPAAHAQIAVTTPSTNLRPTSSTAHPAIRLLPANATVDVLSLRRRNGYLHVRTRDDSTAGWLHVRNLRIDTSAARCRALS